MFLITSIHSSRMRTARLLPVPPSMYCSRGWGVSASRGVSASWGVSAQTSPRGQNS